MLSPIEPMRLLIAMSFFPSPRFSAGRNAPASAIGATEFTANVSSQASSSISVIEIRCPGDTPAFAIATSIASRASSRPNAAVALKSLTSSRCTVTAEPSARSASAFLGSRTVACTRQPSAAYCFANSRPSPRPAPVTRTVGMAQAFLRAVTSISIFMRGSMSSQTIAVAAGRTSPNTSPSTGATLGQSAASVK